MIHQMPNHKSIDLLTDKVVNITYELVNTNMELLTETHKDIFESIPHEILATVLKDLLTNKIHNSRAFVLVLYNLTQDVMTKEMFIPLHKIISI